MLTCRTKTGPGWQLTCGGQAVALVVFESAGEPTAYPACAEHAPGARDDALDPSSFSADELREWCRQNGLEPAF